MVQLVTGSIRHGGPTELCSNNDSLWDGAPSSVAVTSCA